MYVLSNQKVASKQLCDLCLHIFSLWEKYAVSNCRVVNFLICSGILFTFEKKLTVYTTQKLLKAMLSVLMNSHLLGVIWEVSLQKVTDIHRNCDVTFTPTPKCAGSNDVDVYGMG